MRAASETRAGAGGCRFGKVWEKFFYLIAAVLFALIYLASEAWGGLAVVRTGCALFGVLGVAILLYAWRCSVRSQASTAWRPAEARIVSSEVASEVSRYFPRVRYEYEVEGVTYTSDRIILIDPSYSQADAQALVAKYPVGSRAMAWVDPDDPRTAVLEAGLEGRGRKYAVPAIVGAVFTVFGAAAWFLLPKIAK